MIIRTDADINALVKRNQAPQYQQQHLEHNKTPGHETAWQRKNAWLSMVAKPDAAASTWKRKKAN